MQQKEKGANKLKIGCSEDPKERLEEIKRQERNDKIKLLTSIKARKMRDAETAAQDAVKKIGLKTVHEEAAHTGTLLRRRALQLRISKLLYLKPSENSMLRINNLKQSHDINSY